MLKEITFGVVIGAMVTLSLSQAHAEEGSSVAKLTGTDHPLDAEIRSAKTRLETVKGTVKDYSCRFIKRERVGGELRPYEIIDMKVRHEPFSVHMTFLKPDDVTGQIVSFVEGHNNGKMIAKPVGIRGALGAVAIRPDGPLAMEGQRYPITHVGFVNLTEELIMVAERDRQYGECQVKHFRGAKIGERTCTVTEVTHPVPRKEFRFHRARIFVDDETDLPIRFVSWSWPTEKGGKPVLEEEYTYTNVKVNRGFTDADFKVE